jgi:signal transduction histidine kinase
MQADLAATTARFSRDFDSSITHVYSALLGSRGPQEQTPEDFAKRWTDWSASSADRNLVRGFYLAVPAGKELGGSMNLLQFDRASGSLKPADWPPAFAHLRSRLESEHARPSMMANSVDSAIPAVVAPHLHFSAPPSNPGEENGYFRRPAVASWAIGELDLDWIEKQLLPELVERHFSGGDGFDYQVAIVSGKPPGKLLYTSDPKLSLADFATSDSTAALLNVRPDLMMRQPDRSGPRQGDWTGPRPPDWSGNRKGSAYAGDRTRRRREGGFLAASNAENPRWELRVRHPSGSLDAAVTSVRHRDLAISFAGLLVLAATTVMLVVFTRRAQRLAELQIEFVAGVSHELRTPLSVICSAGDNLADGVAKEPQQVRRYGSVIRKEGRRLSEVVDQILVFAAGQTGRVSYNLQPVRVPEIIDRAIEACGTDLNEGGWKIEKAVPSDLPPVMADPVSLTHCIRNLVSNAAKYSRDGHWIGVSAEVARDKHGPELRISVRDRGPGIEPADLPHIFEPFYRGHKVVAEQVRGAGLGLSLVRRIIEAHSGEVTVSSTPGQGSCFTLHLPAGAAAQPAASD